MPCAYARIAKRIRISKVTSITWIKLCNVKRSETNGISKSVAEKEWVLDVGTPLCWKIILTFVLKLGKNEKL